MTLASGRTATAEQWVAATGAGRVLTLGAPALVRRPALPAAGDHSSLRKVQRFVAPAPQVVVLYDAYAWGPDGTVVTADGCLVEDLTRAWGQSPDDHAIWNTPPRSARHLAGAAAVVAARGAATNFSHLLADTLPRIQLVRDAGVEVDTWIVSGREHGWQRECLELAGIGPDATIALSEVPAVSADALVVPSRTGFAPATAPWARERLTTLIKPGDQRRDRRIFISRNNAARRRLLNEDDVVEVLMPLGFEPLDFDKLPVADQIQAVNRACTVVAVHGAALAHLLLAPAGGDIIEIAHPDAIHPDYWGLAGLAGWRHAFVSAQATRPRIPEHKAIKADLTADLAALRQALSTLA